MGDTSPQKLPDEVAQLPRGFGLWWRWTLATALGEFAGFAVPAIVGAVVAATLGTAAIVANDVILTVAVSLAGMVEGITLGYVQWRVLRMRLPRMTAREWVVPTALAAGIAYLFGMTPATLANILSTDSPLFFVVVVIASMLILLSIGTAQWLTLRHYLRRAGWWIPANILAWLFGLPAPFLGLAAVPDNSPTATFILVGILSGLLMGIAVGAITGIVLVRLLHTSPPASETSF